MGRQSEEILTVKMMADRAHACEATIRKLCANGTLPAVRIGRKWVVPESRFLEYLGVRPVD